MNLKTKLNDLLKQKETIENELNMLNDEYEKRKLTLIKIIGSIETLNELIILNENDENCDCADEPILTDK